MDFDGNDVAGRGRDSSLLYCQRGTFVVSFILSHFQTAPRAAMAPVTNYVFRVCAHLECGIFSSFVGTEYMFSISKSLSC